MAASKTTGKQRVAIVTGGTRGIGAAVVTALLDAGWRVAFCSRREDVVVNLHGTLAGKYGDDRVHSMAVDVRDPRIVGVFVNEVGNQFGRVDCLVNNAGVANFAPVDELDTDSWQQQIETNLNGPFYCIQAVVPWMRKAGGGTIFNIASVAGRTTFAGGAAYNASKFGLVALSEAAMQDLRHDGIRVSAILPGSVATSFLPTVDDTVDRDWMLRPEDIARLIVEALGWPDRMLPVRIEVRPTQPPPK